MTTRTIHKLNDRKVKAASAKTCRPHDGGGLYLNCEPPSCSWEFQFDLNRKRHIMGLGSYPAVPLPQARELHKDAKALVRAGINPIIARKQKLQIAATSLTVMEAAEAYITVMEKDWKTERYAGQIRERLETYVAPIIGDMPISDVQFAEAKLVLGPIWSKIRPTAKRIRQHLEGTVNWAIAEGVRKDESNPFETRRLKFSLSFADQKVTHFAALPYTEAPRFLAELRAQQESVKTLALEFTLLNATRVGDICGGDKKDSLPALWEHVDLAERTWRIPVTKTSKELVVPLSDAAMRVLDRVRRFRDPATNVIFPGSVKGTVIADSTLRYLIVDLGYKGLMTTHGCRSQFRSWAGEMTHFERDVVEMALAHAQPGVAAAYMRGNLLAKRRNLMEAWAGYLEGDAVRATDSVIALRRA